MQPTSKLTLVGANTGSSAQRDQPEAVPQRLAPDARRNRLLASLPDADWQRLRPLLEPMAMPLGGVLYEPGALLTHAYFPTTAIVSLLYVTENGPLAQLAVVGNEGIIGVPLFMGGGSTPSRAVVHSAGEGFRIPGPAIREEFERSPSVMKLLLRYTQALIAQTAQTAVCNRHHTVDQQLCRWLLLNLDRQPGMNIVVTQGLMAQLLGVRREGITEAAGRLQRAGCISYRRGQITVLDRPRLATQSCECYAVVKAEYDRLLTHGLK